MKQRFFFLFSLLACLVLWAMSGSAQTSQDLSREDKLLVGGAAPPMGMPFGAVSLSGPVQHQKVRVHPPAASLPPGVRRRVPQDYSTIQAAINASADGDTVLVSEGTYYENIRYRGKAIIVASLYLVDGDTNHIPATVINGSTPSHPDSGSVVYFIDGEDTTSVLNGFTITGGTATKLYDSGWWRFGGGIYCCNAGARIANNIIARNRIIAEASDEGALGGGIGAASYSSVLPDVIVEGNRITDNYVECGHDWGGSGGARFYSVNIRFVGNIVERDTVTGVGAEDGGIGIVGDRSRIPHPRGYVKGNIFRSNILNASSLGAVGAGMALGSTGEVTIQENLFENNTGTSVSGWAQGAGLLLDDQFINDPGRKTVIKNRFLSNHVTHGGSVTESGAGVYLFRTSATLDGNLISGNTADGRGGGFGAYQSAFLVENNIITGNTTTTSGGGCAISYGPLAGTERVFVNNTIVDNQAGYYGGGLTVSGGGPDLVVLNNIVWGNTAQNYAQIYAPGTTAKVNYCDVQGGWAGVGNINTDPGFQSGGFSLGLTSPCIGAGRDTLTTIPATDYYGQPRPEPAGSRPDIGAIESPLSEPAPSVRYVPQDYPTIQAAIDAAVNGDVVLVSDGTYYENIRFRGKRIVVASTYLTTNDTSHIANTIINGSTSSHPDSGSVVYFINGEDTTSVLCGFTITGGTGTKWHNAPRNHTIRMGGGIWCMNSGARIVRNIIAQNKVIAPTVPSPGLSSGWGGGLCAVNLNSTPCTVVLESNIIAGNIAYGLGNTRWMNGGGAVLASMNGRIVGNVFERDSVTSSFGGEGGGLIIGLTDMAYLLPTAHVERNVFRSNVVTVASQGAVGVGLMLLQTDESTVSGNLFEGNIGTSQNGWAQGGGLLVDDHLGSQYGRKMIVKNRFLDNRLRYGPLGSLSGGALCLYRTLATVDGNEIAGNVVDRSGGGIASYMSSFRIQNNIITGNTTTTYGAGCAVDSGTPLGIERLIVNNTIVDNQAGNYGGGLLIKSGGSDAVVLNNIIWGNIAQSDSQIYAPGTTTKVNYCDVQGGYAGTGNIDAPPLFGAGGYSLSDASPCIGVGIDSMNIGGVWYVAPDHCIFGGLRPNPPGSNPDMGACESPLAVDVEETPGSGMPSSFALSQNYPNPFNPATKIQFTIVNRQSTIIKVFDLLGREVATLVNEVKEPGTYTVQWDASGVSSGVYFYRLRAGNFMQTKRMILVR